VCFICVSCCETKAVCSDMKRMRYADFAFDNGFARRPGFRDCFEMQEWFGDPIEYANEEYDVITFNISIRACMVHRAR